MATIKNSNSREGLFLQYEELITFVTLAELKNFTRTAEKLLMSQPSVSLHIKNLENEFQTKLFHRSPKFLQITPSGELLLERAIQMIKIYENTKKDILELNNSIRGELKIGASFTIGEYILPYLLCDLQEDYPELELEVIIGNTEEIVQLVRTFQVDIGLIEGQTNEKELMVYPFLQDELFVVASNNHPLSCKKEVSISELQNQSWILRENGSGTGDYLKHVISSNGLKVKSLLKISSNQGIKESVINGMGLSLLSQSVIQRDVKHKYFSILKLNNQSFRRTFSYVYSPIMRDKRTVKAFISALKRKWDNS